MGTVVLTHINSLQREIIPSNWTQTTGDKWDAGYEKMAFVPKWIDQKVVESHVRKLNEVMAERYEESPWSKLNCSTASPFAPAHYSTLTGPSPCGGGFNSPSSV
jgi:hypothetical protein